MPHRGNVAREQLVRGVAVTLVERRQHDVETLEDRVPEIEPTVGEDVDFASVEECQARVPLAERRDLLGLPRDGVGREVARGRGVRRVVGDRDVLVSQRRGRLDHRRH
jgi:hypothetical protein